MSSDQTREMAEPAGPKPPLPPEPDWRTDWAKVNAGCGGAKPGDNDLVLVTRESARLGAAAIATQNRQEAYHNFLAAGRELTLAAAMSNTPAPAAEECPSCFGAGWVPQLTSGPHHKHIQCEACGNPKGHPSP